MNQSGERQDIRVCPLISESRGVLMGIFMVLIMLFHNHFGILGKWGLPISAYGHWGVDAFLFISGFSLFYALRKITPLRLGQFYRRRIIRILPAAVIAGCTLYCLNLTDASGLFGLNLWYIRTILILYLIAPILYKLITQNNALFVLIATVAFSATGLLVFIPLLKGTSFICQSTISWTLARLPVFLMGMYIARMDFNLRQMMRPAYILFSLTCIAAALYLHYLRLIHHSFSTHLHLFPYLLIAIGMPLMITLLSLILSRITFRAFNRIWAFIGACSLELYLVHEAIFKKVSELDISPGIRFIPAYGLAFFCAILLKYVADKLAPGKKESSYCCTIRKR